jgi:hypothetical protein
VIARIVPSAKGPVYETYRPLLPGKLFVGPGALTRGLARKDGRRLREAGGSRRILLASDEAERYTFSSEHWGTLPAWCRGCGETHWLRLSMLRAAVSAGQREVLLEGRTVR